MRGGRSFNAEERSTRICAVVVTPDNCVWVGHNKGRIDRYTAAGRLVWSKVRAARCRLPAVWYVLCWAHTSGRKVLGFGGQHISSLSLALACRVVVQEIAGNLQTLLSVGRNIWVGFGNGMLSVLDAGKGTVTEVGSASSPAVIRGLGMGVLCFQAHFRI